MNNTTTLALPTPRLAEGRFDSCVCLTDEALFRSTGVRIAFSERCGGVSEVPFDSLNLGAHVHDDSNAVASNRETLLGALGAREAVLVAPHQVHGVDIASFRAREEALRFSAGGFEADGVIVGCRDVAALLCFADCVPVVGVSPAGSFFVAHAGWRGAVGLIAQSAVDALCALDGVDPSVVNAYIGPYIHACHFEVGSDVHERFVQEFGDGCASDERHIDLGFAVRASLVRAGVVPERIADADICTVCDGGHRFYSYRASGGTCGRHGALAVRLAEKGFDSL